MEFYEKKLQIKDNINHFNYFIDTLFTELRINNKKHN